MSDRSRSNSQVLQPRTAQDQQYSSGSRPNSQVLQPSTIPVDNIDLSLPQGLATAQDQQHNSQMHPLICAYPASGGRLPVWEYGIGDTTYYHPLSTFTPAYEGSWEKDTILAVFGPTRIAVLTSMEQVEATPEWRDALRTDLDGVTESLSLLFDDIISDEVWDNQFDTTFASPAGDPSAISSISKLSTTAQAGTSDTIFALPAGNPSAISLISKPSTTAQAGISDRAKVPCQSLQRAHKRTVSQFETEEFVKIKELKRWHEPSCMPHLYTYQYCNGERTPALYSTNTVSNSQWSDTLGAIPNCHVGNSVVAELQQPGFDDMPQYPDIDDIIADAQRRAGMRVTSKKGAQRATLSPSPATSRMTSQQVHGAELPTQGLLRFQQAPPGRTSTISGTPRFPFPSKSSNPQQTMSRRHTFDRMHNNSPFSKLDQGGVASAVGPKDTLKLASTIEAPFGELAARTERQRSLPNYEMWSKFLSPEGIEDLFPA